MVGKTSDEMCLMLSCRYTMLPDLYPSRKLSKTGARFQPIVPCEYECQPEGQPTVAVQGGH